MTCVKCEQPAGDDLAVYVELVDYSKTGSVQANAELCAGCALDLVKWLDVQGEQNSSDGEHHGGVTTR